MNPVDQTTSDPLPYRPTGDTGPARRAGRPPAMITVLSVPDSSMENTVDDSALVTSAADRVIRARCDDGSPSAHAPDAAAAAAAASAESRVSPSYEELERRVAELEDANERLASLEALVAAMRESLAASPTIAPVAASPTIAPVAATASTTHGTAATASTTHGAAAPAAAPAASTANALAADRGQWSRRALLFGGAAAAIGGAAGIAGANPAAAATGTFTFGAANDAGSSQTSLTAATGSSPSTLKLTNTGFGSALSATAAGPEGVGDAPAAVAATASGKAWGVRASADTGYGVHATSSAGAPLRIDCPNRLNLPTSGFAGEFIAFGGQLWFCVQGGTPARWRLLASTSSAGAFVPITPARVYDSRFNSAVDAPPGAMSSGQSRLISVAEAFDPNTNTSRGTVVPSGARAVAINLTVAGPTKGGFMFVAPGTATQVTASTINWSAAGVTLSNSAIVALDSSRQLKAFLQCSGGVGTTQFLIDVAGYYLGA